MKQSSGLALSLCLLICLIAATSCANGQSSTDGGTDSGGTDSSDSDSSTVATSTEIAAIVLDSLNGSAVADATVTIVDSTGASVGPFTTGSDGSVSLTSSLAIGSSYSLIASKSGLASSEMLDYVAQAGTTVSLYCHALAMTSVEARPPILASLECSSDGGATWTSLSSGAELAAGFEIRASVAGVVAVEETSWSGFGVKIDFDRMPTTNYGFEASSYEVKSKLDADETSPTYGKFITTAIFDLSSDSFTSGSHVLELVAYDIANNRVEKRLAFTVETGNDGGGSLSGASFSEMTLSLQSYGKSASSFAFRGTGGEKALTASSSASSYYSLLSFYLTQRGSYVKILGFDVYRSSDGSSYDKIATANYGSLSSNGTLDSAFYYSDYDSTLELGATYYYKVKAFSDDSHYSSFSPILSASFVAPFTASLSSPKTGATLSSDDLASTPFTFAISDPALWSSSAADYFYFALLVKDEAGDPAFYGEFRYDFAEGQFEAPGRYNAGVASWNTCKAASGLAYSEGTVSIDLSTACAYADTYVCGSSLSLTGGSAYEWDIFGAWWGASYDAVGSSSSMDSAYFVKEGTITGTATGDASSSASGVSYANTYMGGAATLNGAFEFNYEE